MPVAELTDEEVFGTKEMSDADVFGANELSDAEVGLSNPSADTPTLSSELSKPLPEETLVQSITGVTPNGPVTPGTYDEPEEGGLLTQLGIPQAIAESDKHPSTGRGYLPEIVRIPTSSVAKTTVGIVDWMTSPSGSIQLAAAAVPGLNVVMAGKFLKDMVEGGAVNVAEAIDAYEHNDWQRLSDNIVGAAASFLGSAAVGKHGVKTAREYFDVLKEKAVPGSVVIPPIETTLESGQRAALIDNLNKADAPLTAEAIKTTSTEIQVAGQPSGTKQTLPTRGSTSEAPAPLPKKTLAQRVAELPPEEGRPEPLTSQTYSEADLKTFQELTAKEGELLKEGTETVAYKSNRAEIEALKNKYGGNRPAEPEPPRIEPGVAENPVERADPMSVEVEKPAIDDWTSATADTASVETPKGKSTAESAGNFPRVDPTELNAGIPIPKFGNRKMSPLDKVTTTHSAKLQKSTDEARRAQREIKKEVPSERRQSAISIWREANGDVPTLKSWSAAAKGKVFKQAAIDAQSLSPKEIAIANKAIGAFSVLEKRGNTFDVLKSHRDNYIPHIWNVQKPGTGWGGNMLKQRFRFSKARTFNTFFEGDQAGFKPKTIAIGKLLPAYIHEMNSVIADRQMVRDITKGEMPDGSPMAVQRGNVKPVESDSGKAVLVQPRASREADTSDYRVMNDQPALSGWTWEGKDTGGKPVFVKADLGLHPDVYRRVNAMIGQSALRTWYREDVSGTAQIPRAIARGLDTAQGVMKREMFGLLAPFHQVQEGTHGIGHQVNPFFGLEKIDLRKPNQMDAANHGLMLLPDRASARVYLEGVGNKTSLLSRGIRKVPKVGEAISDVIDGYQDYLFHQYIPALKFKTYEAMLGRNTKLYAEELKSGEMSESDVKITSAEQANAAYGHLNYALLDRNPTIQHIIQLSALAPDFLEARARFTGQGIKGLSSKVGHEQLKAIAILAAAQAGTAFILSNLLGDEYDPTHPFEVVHKGRRYAMRSVPEDIYGLLKDTRQFLYARANPLTVKGGVQLATGLNYRGEKVTPFETFTELLAGYIPITARAIPGIRSLTETSRNNPVSPLQQLAGSLGLRISRYSPVSETYKLAGEWVDKQKLSKDRGSYPISKYQQLRYALEDGDIDRAKTEYDELKKTMTADKISSGFRQSINHPFTGSLANDAKFAASLKGYDKEMYQLALRTRQNILNLGNKIGLSSSSSHELRR